MDALKNVTHSDGYGAVCVTYVWGCMIVIKYTTTESKLKSNQMGEKSLFVILAKSPDLFIYFNGIYDFKAMKMYV